MNKQLNDGSLPGIFEFDLKGRIQPAAVMAACVFSVLEYVFPSLDQPIIRLKHRNGSQVQALAGQRSFRLSPKIRAFPAPEIIWYGSFNS